MIDQRLTLNVKKELVINQLTFQWCSQGAWGAIPRQKRKGKKRERKRKKRKKKKKEINDFYATDAI